MKTYFKNWPSRLLMLLPLVALTACSKTVQWEEEVPLNTGETIWVKRTDTFERRSEPGNPLQFGWWPISREVKFNWQGQAYAFQTDTTAIFMIHEFYEPKTVAVVAWKKDCGKRGYAEYRWLNGNWQLQKNVSPTLVGQPRNLMDYYSATDGDIPARVTQEFIRNSRFDLPQKGGTESHLLESRISSNCAGSN